RLRGDGTREPQKRNVPPLWAARGTLYWERAICQRPSHAIAIPQLAPNLSDNQGVTLPRKRGRGSRKGTPTPLSRASDPAPRLGEVARVGDRPEQRGVLPQRS